MNRFFHKPAALAVALAATAALTSPATNAIGSNDRLQMSAAHCVKHGSGGSFKRYNNGRIYNNSTTQTLRVICPITRVAHGDDFKVLVFVDDNNPYWDYDLGRSKNVFCSVYDNNAYGEGWQWHAWKDSGDPLGGSIITFNDTDMRHHGFGSLSLLCDIPEKTNSGTTRISGYAVQRY